MGGGGWYYVPKVREMKRTSNDGDDDDATITTVTTASGGSREVNECLLLRTLSSCTSRINSSTCTDTVSRPTLIAYFPSRTSPPGLVPGRWLVANARGLEKEHGYRVRLCFRCLVHDFQA